MTTADLASQSVNLEIDGVEHIITLQQLQEGNFGPFQSPLSAAHKQPASGMGAFTPFCYQRYAKVK